MKNLCKANHGLECMKCTQGPCDSRITVGPYVMPTTDTKIPMPQVKAPKTSVGSLTVDVGVNGMDEAIKQLETLKKLYTDIDALQQRIIKGQEKINYMPYRPVESVQLHVGESIISKKGYEEIQKRIHEEILKSLGGEKRFGV